MEQPAAGGEPHTFTGFDWDDVGAWPAIAKHFPSSGPYKIESVLDGGAVVLVANERWWGAKPMTKRITVWPQKADIQDRVNAKSADVVDVAAGSSGALATPDNYRRTDAPSYRARHTSAIRVANRSSRK